MLAHLKEPFGSLSGSIGKDEYVSNAPGRPGWVIVKKKPGPRNPRGKRKNLWVMPETQKKGVDRLKANQNKASQLYKDPIEKERLRQEYIHWKSEERRHGRDGFVFHGKRCRYLWDYVRIRVGVESVECRV